MWHIKIVPLDFGTVNCICLEKFYVENIDKWGFVEVHLIFSWFICPDHSYLCDICT